MTVFKVWPGFWGIRACKWMKIRGKLVFTSLTIFTTSYKNALNIGLKSLTPMQIQKTDGWTDGLRNRFPRVLQDFIHGKNDITLFLVADTQLYKRLSPSVGPSVRQHESKSGKTRISAPAHPSATDGRVSGLVFLQFCQFHMCTIQEQSRGKSFLY